MGDQVESVDRNSRGLSCGIVRAPVRLAGARYLHCYYGELTGLLGVLVSQNGEGFRRHRVKIWPCGVRLAGRSEYSFSDNASQQGTASMKQAHTQSLSSKC